MESRAYTHVDRGAVTLGNRWIERRWSAFLGNTISLTQKGDGFEWVSGQCAEFRVEVNGDPMGIMEFGELSWSEENSPIGATVVGTKIRPGLEVTVRTLACHNFPALVRTLDLLNSGETPISIGRVVVESLRVDVPGARVWTHRFTQGHKGVVWETEERAAAVTLPDRGLFLGLAQGGIFELYAPEPGTCNASVAVSRDLAPGATWTAPPSFILAYCGNLADAVAFTYGDFIGRFPFCSVSSAGSRP